MQMSNYFGTERTEHYILHERNSESFSEVMYQMKYWLCPMIIVIFDIRILYVNVSTILGQICPVIDVTFDVWNIDT